MLTSSKTTLEWVLKLISFQASRGWFDKLKKSGIHSIVRRGEAASSNKVATDNFVIIFQEYMNAEWSVPQQVLNYNEVGP